MDNSGSLPLSVPPEGVLAGEPVPRENEEWIETEIDRMIGVLKQQGKPFASMSEAELRDRAVDRLEKLTEDHG